MRNFQKGEIPELQRGTGRWVFGRVHSNPQEEMSSQIQERGQNKLDLSSLRQGSDKFENEITVRLLKRVHRSRYKLPKQGSPDSLGAEEDPQSQGKGLTRRITGRGSESEK